MSLSHKSSLFQGGSSSPRGAIFTVLAGATLPLQHVDLVKTEWRVRLASEDDIPALEKLIALSARGLRAPYYSDEQVEAALGSVFGVDRQLIRDKTYFVVEHQASGGTAAFGAAAGNEFIGCGGWSKRKTLFGNDHLTNRDDAELNPASDAARIRAFFVHPAWARRGIARAILEECERAIRAATFKSIELAATLPGVPFYGACGYIAGERLAVSLPNKLNLRIVRMTKDLR
jgi:GNAT superfamily N-acetyltransferase